MLNFVFWDIPYCIPLIEPDGSCRNSYTSIRKYPTYLTRAFTPWIILSLGILLRIGYLFLIYGRIDYWGNEAILSDSLSYYTDAVRYGNGDQFLPFWPPGLPHYLAGIIALFGKGFLQARISMLVWYIALSGITFTLMKKIYSAGTANIALLLIACYPVFIHQSVDPLTHLPTATLLLGIVYMCIRMKEESTLLWPVLIGVGGALMILFRPSATLIVLMLPLLIWLLYKKPLSALVVLIFPILIIGGWNAHLYHQAGRTVYVNDSNAYNMFIGNNEFTPLYKTWLLGSHWAGESYIDPQYAELASYLDALPASERTLEYRELTLMHIMKRPDLFVLRSLNRARTFWTFDTLTGSSLINSYGLPSWFGYLMIVWDAGMYFMLMLMGILAFRNPFRAAGTDVEKMAVLLTAGYFIPYCLAFSHPTYHLPVLPLVLLFAGGTIESWSKGKLSWAEIPLKLKENKRWIAVAVLIFIQIEWVSMMIL